MHKTRSRLASSILLICFVSVACTPQSSAPGPDTLSGTIASAGYSLHRWDEGLSILILHEAPGSFLCEGAGSSTSPEYVLECQAGSDPGIDLAWTIRSENGEQAVITVGGDQRTLTTDALILVRSEDGSASIEQHDLELSAVGFEHTEILQLAEVESVIQDFVTSLD